MTKPNYCPICKTLLQKPGNSYSINELFELWMPVKFSKGTVEEHRRQNEYTEMHSCPQCRLDIFLPQIIGTPNFYKELQENSHALYYVDEKWEFNEALKDAKTCNSIIEIGCGPGNFLAKANSVVSKIYGTETNESALQVARNKGLNVFKTENDLCGMRGKFDAAFSFHVLEHIPDPIAFFQKLCSWVRPGGKIGVSVPNQDGPVKYIDPCAQNMPPHHATRWRPKTFKVLAEILGLKIDRISYEPLIIRDYYYYSTYWVDYKYSKKSLSSNFLRRILHKTMPGIFRTIFKILAKFNRTSLGLMKGQSIYVLMSKPDRSSV